MKIDSFLQPEALIRATNVINAPRISRAAKLVLDVGEQIDQIGLQHRFVEFQEARLLDIETIIEQILEMIRQVTPNNYDERVIIVRMGKFDEVAAIVEISGILKDPNKVHLWDACGGNGFLSFVVAYMRKSIGATSATCIEKVEGYKVTHDNLRRIILPENGGLHFFNKDVEDVNFPNAEAINTYCIAKHACGTATDKIIAKIAKQKQPPRTAIMTCCHGLAKKSHTKNTAIELTAEEWEVLAQTADWNMADIRTIRGIDQETFSIVGRVAMRVMDLIRASAINKDTNWRVEEILPKKTCPKNHCIVV